MTDEYSVRFCFRLCAATQPRIQAFECLLMMMVEKDPPISAEFIPGVALVQMYMKLHTK